MSGTLSIKRLVASAAFGLLLVSGNPVAGLAQSDDTVRLIVGYGPGGGNDLTARILADALSDGTGKSYIVENKPGAASRLAADYVSKQTPDGSVLLVSGNSAITMAAAMYPDLTYDPLADLVPVIALASYPPLVLIVGQDNPAQTLPELIAWSNANPEASNYAGVAAAYTIPTEMLKIRSGMDAEAVTYKSSSEALVSVMRGEVTMMLALANTAVPAIEKGDVRALAVTGDERIAELPDVPSMGEFGYPDVDIDLWTGVFAPKGTPPEVAEAIAADFESALKNEEVLTKLGNLGLSVNGVSTGAFAGLLEGEKSAFVETIEEANLTFE